MESINKSVTPITKSNVSPYYQKYTKRFGKVYIV